MEPIPDVRLTVIVDRYPALYSGMLPGVVAGEYRLQDTVIDLRPLCLRAGARCFLGRASRIDPERRKIEIDGRPAVRYDLASIDIGSSVLGQALPGVEEHTIATRPIGLFMSALEDTLSETAKVAQTPQVVVVGAGAAGMELALCLRTRLGEEAAITILTRGSSVLEGMNGRLGQRLIEAANARNILIQTQVEVRSVESDRVHARDSTGKTVTLPAHLTLWATGAAPAPLGAQSNLPLTAEGFIRTDPYLRVLGHEDLYAVGDCAVPDHAPQLPRAGVHAVRQGPALDANLRAQCLGRPLKPYRPQSDFLALLNLGDGRAAGGKWGLALSNRLLRRIKHRIDDRFMERFRVLDATGCPASSFPRNAAMEKAAEEMLCGGCAAKVGPSPLQDALRLLPTAPADPSVRLGLNEADDVAAVDLPEGGMLLASIDAFRAFTDDPWRVGQVAAINAINDVFAKGGRPRHALALVTVPEGPAEEQSETLYQVLSGIRNALDPLAVSLVGGHSTTGSELFIGLSVTGEPMIPGQLLGINGLQAGNALILTKPLGTGVLLAADMRGQAPGDWMEALFESMLQDSESAAQLALRFGASASTDISGFGLGGHLLELCDASGVSARVNAHALPTYAGAISLMKTGLRSTFFEQNAALRSRIVPSSDVSPEYVDLLFDPQTAGGLLIGVKTEQAQPLLQALHQAGISKSRIIGHTEATTSNPRILLDWAELPGPAIET